MALRFEISAAFRKQHGDEMAVALVIRNLYDELVAHVKQAPDKPLRFRAAVSSLLEDVPDPPPVGLIPTLVEQYSHDGLSDESLRFVLETAASVPYGAALEIGSFKGGTALALMALRDWSLFVTVDPYGVKAYAGGDGLWEGLYGDEVYVAQKSNLACCGNHAHFLMTGIEFLERNIGFKYWRNGFEHTFGIHRGVGGGGRISFAFVDGEHSLEAVQRELELLRPHMHPQGKIIVDNIDKDKRLQEWLVSIGAELGPEVPEGARQAVLVGPGEQPSRDSEGGIMEEGC